jgi:hypothetical protein
MTTTAVRPGDQDAGFREWFGFRLSEAATCPRVAAGKRCRVGYFGGDRCICQRYAMTLLDHSRIWLDEDGRHAYTAEPYNFDGAEFAELAAECAGLGLSIYVTGRSPYFPGCTVLLVISRCT